MSGRSAFTRAVTFAGPVALVLAFACSRPPAPGLRAEIRSSLERCEAFEAETAFVPLTVVNTGSTAWESGGKPPVFLSYHVLDAEMRPVRFEGARTALPGRIEPGAEADAEVLVKAPLAAGRYNLEFDGVAEGLSWFKDGGSRTLVLPFEVRRRAWPEDAFALSLESGPYTKIETSVPELDTLMKLVRITLKHNEVSFEGETGRVDGFSAGSGYPQVWVRDANTIIPASKYFYPASRLSSWLDELLSHQEADGALPDWFDSRGATDKNTVETDQEASAVQAEGQVADLAGPEWERREVRSFPALLRLERALESVIKNRFDVDRLLVIGAHTADWGDVETEDADQSAIYAGETTRWTSDIYDQSMFFEAANDLAQSLEANGAENRARLWRKRAEALRRAADRWLWQEDLGFYRVHVHEGAWRHDLDENAIFAMGGNVQAMISGLAGPPDGGKWTRIIEQALARQKEFGVSTIGGTLLPPYPAGFFRHPALDEPYEYQNGGQWDWFGGKLVLAMFESGFSREAREKLIEIARKNVANGGLYEWDTKDGQGRGSDFYSGSAGSLTRALVEGYLGVRLTRSALEITPRLGLDSARVHFYLPAAERFAAYDYRADKMARTIRLEIGCDVETGAVISILNPWEPSESGVGSKLPQDLEVRVDGREVSFHVERIGRDEYIKLDGMTTRFKKAVVEVRIRPSESVFGKPPASRSLSKLPALVLSDRRGQLIADNPPGTASRLK
jgi:hypothetical protein